MPQQTDQTVSYSAPVRLFPLLMNAIKTYFAWRKTHRMVRSLSPRLREDSGLNDVGFDL